jgi:hypothetical protein
VEAANSFSPKVDNFMICPIFLFVFLRPRMGEGLFFLQQIAQMPDIR